MASGISLSARFSAASLQAISRFGKTPVQAAAEKALLQLGRDAVRSLATASPVKTGALRASWRAAYDPGFKRVTISNFQPYSIFVAFGTSRMPPNPTLKAAIEALPDTATVALHEIGRETIQQLGG